MKKNCVAIIIVVLFAVFAYLTRQNAIRDIDVFNHSDHFCIDATVILDAGHGGEDGGAVALDGTLEKDLNLRFTKCISSFLELFGVTYQTTRTTDISVGDTSLDSIRERKRSDILTRFRLVNKTPNSVLLSIHQNLFVQSKYSGTQVFYAKYPPESENLARSIQTSVSSMLQPENDREIKVSDNNIYLLYHAQRPSVLVECGFLSNPEELTKLKSPEYQAELSYAIVKGFINYFVSQQIDK